MPGYIVLGKFTQQQFASIKDRPEHLRKSKAHLEQMGVRVVGAWVTMGEYDTVMVVEAPDDQAMALVLLAGARQGNVATQTMRAFSEDEFAQIVSKLP